MQVIYYVSGPAHLPYLVCSLYTLRKHWDGKVLIYVWPQSAEIVSRIAVDPRLSAYWKFRPEAGGSNRFAKLNGKKRQALDRILVMQEQREVTLYLDCDTTIHGPLHVLMDLASQHGYAATQWCDWTTLGNRVSKRLARLRLFRDIDQRLVEELLKNRYPALNCGVVACRPDSPVLSMWLMWSEIASSMFIPDEVAQHLAMPKFNMAEFVVATDLGKWNSSPHLKSAQLKHEDVSIYHYHGSSCCRPDKSKRGCDLWLPIYDECLRENVGGMAEWRGEVSNKHLDKVRSV